MIRKSECKQAGGNTKDTTERKQRVMDLRFASDHQNTF